MKRTLAILSLLACHLSLFGQVTPVLFSMINLTGTVNNRSILITPDTVQNPLNLGTNLVSLLPFTIQPVNGQVITNLAPWGYNIKVDGWPRSVHIVVPASTNLLNVVSLLNTNQFSPLNLSTAPTLVASNNITLHTNSDGSVSIGAPNVLTNMETGVTLTNLNVNTGTYYGSNVFNGPCLFNGVNFTDTLDISATGITGGVSFLDAIGSTYYQLYEQNQTLYWPVNLSIGGTNYGNGAGLTNVTASAVPAFVVTNDIGVQNFINAQSLTKPASDSVNAMAAILDPAFGTNWDAILFGSQFKPANNLTVRGRAWTSGASVGGNAPGYGDPNYAWFMNNGVQVDGLNLSSYTVYVVFNMNPIKYPSVDADWLGFDTDRTIFNGLLASLLNTNDNSGVCIAGMNVGAMGLAVFPRGTGAGTNNWYDAGVTTYPWQTTTTNFAQPETCSGFNTFGPFEVRCGVALCGNLAGTYQCYLNDAPAWFNNKSTNTFQSTGALFGTTPITTIRIGGDTNWMNPSIIHAGNSKLTNCYGQFRIQSVFIIPTNTQTAVDLAYKAAFYGDTRRKIAVDAYGTSLFDECTFVGGAFSYSSNSFAALMCTENPDWIFETFATAGATVQQALTNSISGTTFPYGPMFNIPSEFQRVVMSDVQRNSLVQPGTSVSLDVVNQWDTTLLTPYVTNNIPIWVWEDPLARTNQGTSWSVAQGLTLNLAYTSFRTNKLFARSLRWGRRVTDGSYVASSNDNLHFVVNGLVYGEGAKEINDQGPVPIQFPQTYVSGATGWTNWTQQTWVASGSAGTSVQAFDMWGNAIFASFTTSAFFNFDVPPGGWFTGTGITGQVHVKQIQ